MDVVEFDKMENHEKVILDGLNFFINSDGIVVDRDELAISWADVSFQVGVFAECGHI